MTDLRCSFCGKHQGEVKKLLAGAKATICDECVATADRLMKESPEDRAEKPPPWRAPPK